MSNEEYQSCCSRTASPIRDRFIQYNGKKDAAMAELLAGYEPDEVKDLLANLGGTTWNGYSKPLPRRSPSRPNRL